MHDLGVENALRWRARAGLMSVIALAGASLLTAVPATPADAIVKGSVVPGGNYADGPPNTNPYAFVGRLPKTAAGKSCSASLVAPSIALSAGHCGIKAGDKIVFGVLNWDRYKKGVEGETRNVKKVNPQKDAPGYQKIVGSSGASTVMLLLDEPVNSIKPVRLVEPTDKKLWAKKRPLRTLGWGYINDTCVVGGKKGIFSKELRSASVKITDTAITVGLYRGLAKVEKIAGRPTHGDSGGPLVTQTAAGETVQVGVYETAVGAPCTDDNYAYYYNRIWPQKKLLTYVNKYQYAQPSPQNVSCVGGPESISLYWDLPASTADFTLTGFTIQMDGGGTYPLPANNTIYTIYELVPGSKHTFVITAEGTPDVGASVTMTCSAASNTT